MLYCRDCREIRGLTVRAYHRKGVAWAFCPDCWKWWEVIRRRIAA